jgi:hypothetical protein
MDDPASWFRWVIGSLVEWLANFLQYTFHLSPSTASTIAVGTVVFVLPATLYVILFKVSVTLMAHRFHRHALRVEMDEDGDGNVIIKEDCEVCGRVFLKGYGDPQTIKYLVDSANRTPRRWVNWPLEYSMVLSQMATVGVITARKPSEDIEKVLGELGGVRLKPHIMHGFFMDEPIRFKLINRRWRTICISCPRRTGILEVRAVEVQRGTHANRIICILQIVAKMKPYEYVLDNVVVGEDASGLWMARPHPNTWSEGLEEQLRWITNVDRGELIEA